MRCTAGKDKLPREGPTIAWEHYMIVFVNKKSGGRDGVRLWDRIAQLFADKRHGECIDLMSHSAKGTFSNPKKMRQWGRRIKKHSGTQPIRAVVAGGDGSIRWVEDIMSAMGMRAVPVALIPIGTGNEMGGTMGWSKAFNMKKNLYKTFANIDHGDLVHLDSWKVDVDYPPFGAGDDTLSTRRLSYGDSGSEDSSSGSGVSSVASSAGSSSSSEDDKKLVDHGSKTKKKGKGRQGQGQGKTQIGVNPTNDPSPTESEHMEMSSFLSIGFDAYIANKFHNLRQRKPGWTSSRGLNKFYHVVYGLGVAVKQRPWLNDHVYLEVDGQPIEFPRPIRCLHILNIRTTGDLDIFKGNKKNKSKHDLITQFELPSFGDGLLEVCATLGPLHLVKMRSIPSMHAIRLAQGREIVITVTKKTTMQMEGEPREIHPCRIRIHQPNPRLFVVGPKYKAENVEMDSKISQSPLKRSRSFQVGSIASASTASGGSGSDSASDGSSSSDESSSDSSASSNSSSS